MSEQPTDDELAEEARRWNSGELTPSGWTDAPDAAPRAKETEAISLRLPKAMLAILKEFARRDGVGYQVLMKRWLDERIRIERERICAARRTIYPIAAPEIIFQAAAFNPRLASQLSEDAGRDPISRLIEKLEAKK
jgi:hypothetical protein